MLKIITSILTGGFVKGHATTYVAGAGLIALGLSKYVTGGETFAQFLTSPDLLTALGGLGLVGVRNTLVGHTSDIRAVASAVDAFVAAQNKPAASSK